ncbi:hypothetical protein [Nonomuraea ferruginea]|uniref:Uncharacterized protein n=1 Tax=Nonomuraea ferruginea TaxID=46174 RepID=A0ABT4T366_9ACTN|nr:hypothetical protein [Nonomuraea ferruginea]MDA0643580.1 hypothetical protein [Nonomuraea ferruginea]
MSDEIPTTDNCEPALLAATWTTWDGRPVRADERVYTPHKAIRRVADHLIDHLAEVEARLAANPTVPDCWHASMITTEAFPCAQQSRR